MNKNVELISLLSSIYNLYEEKNKVSDEIRKRLDPGCLKEDRLAECFNKDLAASVPDISLYFKEPLSKDEKTSIKRRFMKDYDRFDEAVIENKRKYREKHGKLIKSLKEQSEEELRLLFNRIKEVSLELASAPISGEHLKDIPDLRFLINEGCADSIESAVFLLSEKKNHSI